MSERKDAGFKPYLKGLVMIVSLVAIGSYNFV